MKTSIRVILGVALLGLVSRLMLPTIFEVILFDSIYPQGKPIDRFLLSSNGKILVSTCKAGRLVETWDLEKQVKTGTINAANGYARGLVISGTGTHIAWSEEPDNVVRVWKLGPQLTGEFSTEPFESRPAICLNQNAKMLAVGGTNILRLWNLPSGEEIHVQASRGGRIQHLRFSADSKTIAAGSEDSIEVWSIETGKIIAALQCRKHSDLVRQVAFSRNGRFLASSQWETLEILIWDLHAGTVENLDIPPWLAEEDEAIIEFLAFSNDEKTLVAGNGCRIGAWDVASGANFAEMGTSEQNWYWTKNGRPRTTDGPKGMATVYDATFTEDGEIRIISCRGDSILTRLLASPREQRWLRLQD